MENVTTMIQIANDAELADMHREAVDALDVARDELRAIKRELYRRANVRAS